MNTVAVNSDGIIDILSDTRSTSEKFPDMSERNQVLQDMLQFAAYEVAPELFKSIVAEMGVENMDKDSQFISAYTVFDMIKNSGGDGDLVCLLFLCLTFLYSHVFTVTEKFAKF